MAPHHSPGKVPNSAARSELLESWNMPDNSRPTFPEVAMPRPEEPVDASLGHIRYERLQNGNIRGSLVLENVWITALFRNPEGLDDTEGERMVSAEDITFHVGNLLENFGFDDEEPVLEDDHDGPIGGRGLRPETAQMIINQLNARPDANFELKPNDQWWCFFCVRKFPVRQKDDALKHLSTKRHQKSVFFQTNRTEHMTNTDVDLDIGQELTEMMLAGECDR